MWVSWAPEHPYQLFTGPWDMMDKQITRRKNEHIFFSMPKMVLLPMVGDRKQYVQTSKKEKDDDIGRKKKK